MTTRLSDVVQALHAEVRVIADNATLGPLFSFEELELKCVCEVAKGTDVGGALTLGSLSVNRGTSSSTTETVEISVKLKLLSATERAEALRTMKSLNPPRVTGIPGIGGDE